MERIESLKEFAEQLTTGESGVIIKEIKNKKIQIVWTKTSIQINISGLTEKDQKEKQEIIRDFSEWKEEDFDDD